MPDLPLLPLCHCAQLNLLCLCLGILVRAVGSHLISVLYSLSLNLSDSECVWLWSGNVHWEAAELFYIACSLGSGSGAHCSHAPLQHLLLGPKPSPPMAVKTLVLTPTLPWCSELLGNALNVFVKPWKNILIAFLMCNTERKQNRGTTTGHLQGMVKLRQLKLLSWD